MIKAHWAHFKTMARHKWFVALAGWKLGLPLWRLIIHDLSKYSRKEWGAYVRQFYNPDGTHRKVRNADGSYDPNAQANDFKLAWLHHQRNSHHWQAWCSLGDGGGIEALEIPVLDCVEMCADWMGAGRAYEREKWFVGKTLQWAANNLHKMVLDQRTLARITGISLSLRLSIEDIPPEKQFDALQRKHFRKVFFGVR